MKAIILLLALGICTALAEPPLAPPPCNNFPLIFGGNTGDTTMLQIDVFDDYLAFGGSTRDSTLTNFTS